MLLFNEMMKSALYFTNTLSWICIVLALWNNSLCIDMSLLSYTLSWFRANHSLLLLLNVACLAEKQRIPWLILLNLLGQKIGITFIRYAQSQKIGITFISYPHSQKIRITFISYPHSQKIRITPVSLQRRQICYRLFSEYMLTFRAEEPMKICVTN